MMRSEKAIRNPDYLKMIKSQRSSELSRRTILQRIGWGVAAASLTSAAKMYGDSISPVMMRLSEYMSAARDRELPESVIETTKEHILDTFAAMVSGSELPPGRAAQKFARSYGGEKVATVVCSKILTSPIEAALVNGIQAHSDETDDSHPLSGMHPGAPTVSATLAAGEVFGISGVHFLRAIALGYDLGPRMAITMGGTTFQMTSHLSMHSFGGIFAAAAGAGCAASLNSQQMRWLLDYTAQQSAGTAAWQRDTEHIEKGLVFAGAPARSGITSALLIQSGWTGIDDILAGPDNFFEAHAPKANPADLIDRLGEHYYVTETNIKKWSVASPVQATLDALGNIGKRRSFQADDVKQVIVRISPREAAIVDDRVMPDVCLQYLAAVMLLDKTVSFAAAHDKARMQDPEILRQRAKVQLIHDESLIPLLPRRITAVDLILNDGTRLSEQVEAVRGTFSNPMTREEVVAKARDLMAPVLGTVPTTSLIEKVLSLEKVKNIVELRPFLQRA
jgi:2-methylcitrate dehydratase PrpD